jgi:hypothetical protein
VNAVRKKVLFSCGSARMVHHGSGKDANCGPALAESNGKVAGNGAAARLGIPRSTLDLKNQTAQHKEKVASGNVIRTCTALLIRFFVRNCMFLSNDVRWVKIVHRACASRVYDPENKVPDQL